MTQRPAGRQLAAPLENPKSERVRQVASLAGRSARQRHALMLVEGPQAVREAVAWASAKVRDLYVDPEALVRYPDIAQAALDAGLYVHPVSEAVGAALSSDSQGIVATVAIDAIDAAPAGGSVPADNAPVVILSAVRDPGNLGTAIRVADAAGASRVILAGDCVDPANPKVVRSSAGSVFHVPVTRSESVASAVAWCHEQGFEVWAADVKGDIQLGDQRLNLGRRVAWLFGNEAWGLDDAQLEHADAVIRIPIFGLAESLNLGTAVAVALYAAPIAGVPRS